VGAYTKINNGAINIEINISTSRYSINLSVSVCTDMNSREINYIILKAWGLFHLDINGQVSKVR